MTSTERLWSSPEERLKRAFCEEPEAFQVFSSNDGFAARKRANVKGLVAVFLGASRFNKWSLNGKTYDYLAIPSGLAEKLVSGIWSVEVGKDPNADRVLRLLDRKLEKICEGAKKYAIWLRDPETVRDFRKQLRDISFGTIYG